MSIWARLREERLLFASIVLVSLGLALWLGSTIFFGAGVAGSVFRHLPSKDLAGNLNGVILDRLSYVKFAAGALILVGLLMFRPARPSWYARAPFLFLIVMLTLLVVVQFVVGGSINELKSQISSFDHPTAQDAGLIAQFQGYHSVYTQIVKIDMLLAFLLQLLFAGLLVERVAAASPGKPSIQPSTDR